VSTEASPGREFAEALAAKDFERARALLAPDVDFRGLTPNRHWEATDAAGVVDEILPAWLEPSDHLEGLLAVEEDSFADRERVTYSVRGHNDDGPFVFEQLAYYTARNGRIDWMRVICSGFRPG